LECLHEQDTKIDGFHFKKDLKGLYLWDNKSIALFDIHKKARSEWVSSDAPITALAVDPIHEYLTYVTEGKTIHVCDKKSSRYHWCHSAKSSR